MGCQEGPTAYGRLQRPKVTFYHQLTPGCNSSLQVPHIVSSSFRIRRLATSIDSLFGIYTSGFSSIAQLARGMSDISRLTILLKSSRYSSLFDLGIPGWTRLAFSFDRLCVLLCSRFAAITKANTMPHEMDRGRNDMAMARGESVMKDKLVEISVNDAALMQPGVWNHFNVTYRGGKVMGYRYLQSRQSTCLA